MSFLRAHVLYCVTEHGLPLTDHTRVLSQQRLHDLVSEIDPKQVLDEDVEEVSGPVL